MSLSNEFVIEIICYQYYRVLHNIGVWIYKNMLRFPRTSSTTGQRICWKLDRECHVDFCMLLTPHELNFELLIKTLKRKTKRNAWKLSCILLFWNTVFIRSCPVVYVLYSIIHIFVHVNITITITVTNRGKRLSPHHRMIFVSKSHLHLLHTRYSDHIRNFPWFLSIHCIIPRSIHTLTWV